MGSKATVKKWQRALVGNGAELRVDGVFGARTLMASRLVMVDAIRFSAAEGAVARPVGTLPEAVARTAEEMVGTEESGGNNRGERVRMFQEATWLPAGAWPWCAAFVCWCVREAVAGRGTRFVRPQTAGAWDFERWAREQSGNRVELIKPAGANVRRGDIVVFKFSHIGIATETARGGRVQTVEGNTDAEGGRDGDGVWRKSRKVSQVRSVVRLS